MTTPLQVRFVERNLRVYRRVWKGSAVSTFLNPVLFLAAMGLGLGSLVDENAGRAALEGTSYLVFLAPGLLAAQAMQTGFGEGAWPVMAGFKWVKSFHAALASPLRTQDLVSGHLWWTVIRLSFASVVFVAVAAAFGAMPIWAGLVAVAPAVLVGMAHAAPMTAFTPTQQDVQMITNLFRFGVVPMFLFSGTFFPISQLPGWLQPAAWVVPLWHGVELTRATTTAAGTTFPILVHVGYLLAWTVAGWLVAFRTFDRRLSV